MHVFLYVIINNVVLNDSIFSFVGFIRSNFYQFLNTTLLKNISQEPMVKILILRSFDYLESRKFWVPCLTWSLILPPKKNDKPDK